MTLTLINCRHIFYHLTIKTLVV